MQPANVNVAISTGTIVVVTIVAAAAIAVYESPEIRQFAEDCRRRIAVALHSLGDEINPRPRESQPRYNRPEDAEGFTMSSAEPGVDADEDSRRRQREELMYWNQVRLEKQERGEKSRLAEEQEQATRPRNNTRGSSFDDFLHEDQSAEKGTFVYNTGTDICNDLESLTQRRREGVRGLDRAAIYANPFADENNIEPEETQRAIGNSILSPQPSEYTDIYSAEDRKATRESTQTLAYEEPRAQLDLIDVTEAAESMPIEAPTTPRHYPWNENTYMSDTSASEQHPAFASIHAWADNSTGHDASFYSPLPVTPAPASIVSEPGLLSHDGDITPTDSESLAGSGDDIARDAVESEDDAMSEDGEGVSTPGSWTEVGSVVSEDDAGHHH
jgi:hypothetical protein